jgi:hypothetical protein
MGIDVGDAEKLAAVCFDPNLFAALKLFQRRFFAIYFIAVNPKMTALQPSFFVAVQA